MTDAERKQRALEVRRQHYGRRQAPTPAVRHVERVGQPERPRVVWQGGTVGQPCKQNKGWIRSLTSKALSLAKVVSSANVPDPVYEVRMEACLACDHVTKGDGAEWCECCGCPKWNAGGVNSSLRYKNRKAGWRCPRDPPAFGPYEGDN